MILLCDTDETDHLRQMLGAVIDAIVLKVQPAQVLFATIKHLMDIPAPTPPRMSTPQTTVSATSAPIVATTQTQAGKGVGLTERERHIVKLVVEGLSNKEIAARMHLADTTVRHHLTKIFDKLGVSNRQNLLIRAHRHGIG
jgi:DNA-binding NarL/FixJ family response regulator